MVLIIWSKHTVRKFRVDIGQVDSIKQKQYKR